MVAVQVSYLENHLAGRPAEKDARRAFRNVNAFMKARSPRNAAYRVSEFDLIAQREFIRQQNRSPKTVSTELIYISSAIKWAAQDQIVDDGAGERQIRILTHPITVTCGPVDVAKIMDAPDPKRREWIPEPSQLFSFIQSIRKHEMAFRMTVILLNTWCRRQVAFDFHDGMVNRQLGVIDLNPEGRRQTKKRRPIIRLTRNLSGYMDQWGGGTPVRSHTAQHSEITEAFRDTARSLQLDLLTPHVLRHYCATRARSFGAPADEISEWLGHRRQGNTGIYLHMDPDWLVKTRNATDEIVNEVGL